MPTLGGILFSCKHIIFVGMHTFIGRISYPHLWFQLYQALSAMIDDIIGLAAFGRGDGNHKNHDGYGDSTYRKMEEVPILSPPSNFF